MRSNSGLPWQMECGHACRFDLVKDYTIRAVYMCEIECCTYSCLSRQTFRDLEPTPSAYVHFQRATVGIAGIVVEGLQLKSRVGLAVRPIRGYY